MNVPSTNAAPAAPIRMLPLALFALGHVLLATAMRIVPQLGFIHAVVCLGAGAIVAARGRPDRVAYVVAYIAGSEVLWRMSRAGVFWEYGKYSVSFILLIALSRIRPRNNRFIAMAYFGLLLPSALFTILGLAPDLARQQLSFNLSGPLALMLCVLYFSNVRLTPDAITRTFIALLGPVITIATIAYLATVNAQNLEFTGQSNSVTSGGFGPNQVSAMLGLGLLLALLLLLERRHAWTLKIPLIAIAIALATQCALTFSRGGLALAFASAFVAMFYLVRDSRTRLTLVVVGTLLFAVGKYVVVPRLEVFTQGKLSERYTSTKASNRDSLATRDLKIFEDNLALGIGPGMASQLRSDKGISVAAHTEFTRLFAEHGVLGVLALLLLVFLQVRVARQARTLTARAFVLALLCWFTLYLLVNAMRVVAPMVMFGLACTIAHSSVPRRRKAAVLEPAVDSARP